MNKTISGSNKINANLLNLSSSKQYPITVNGKALSMSSIFAPEVIRGVETTWGSGRNSQYILASRQHRKCDSFLFKDGQLYIVDNEGNPQQVIHNGTLQASVVEATDSDHDDGRIFKIKSGIPLTSGSELQIKSSPSPLCIVDDEGHINSKVLFDNTFLEYVMGNVKSGFSGSAYKFGLVREGNANHSNFFLRRDGQWAAMTTGFSGSVAENFLSLNDTPTSYDGNLGKLLITSSDNGGSLQFIASTTDTITEGSNKYYTDSRVDSRLNTRFTDNSITDIRLTGDLVANSVITTSDRRLKTNIKDFEKGECLQMIDNLHPKKFRFKNSECKQRYGLIAQEVEHFYPNLVDTNWSTDNLEKGVNYVDLIGVLIGSIKELNKKIQILEKKVD